jgi:hypothetical protein
MKRFLKYLGLVIAVVGGNFYIVLNHSIADETQIVCKGNFYSDGKAWDEEEIYFKVLKYRWWTYLWGDSDGAVYVERNGMLDVIHDIEILANWGDVVFDKLGGTKRGRYSAMSRTMRYVSGGRLFEGKCVDRK